MDDEPIENVSNPETGSSVWGSVFLLLGLLLAASITIVFANPNLFPQIRTNLNNAISNANTGILPNNVQQQNSTNAITLQQVHDTGYTYYLGQLDVPNAPAISDDDKNAITEVLYEDNFPKSLLTDTAIVIVNTLAATTGQYVEAPVGNLQVQDFSPEFLTGGGEYVSYTDSSGKVVPFSLIFLNKDLFTNGKLASTLSHELGHHVGSTLTATDWQTYYQLRGIPSGTQGEVASWNASPDEDFAEVYKNIVNGAPIQTIYGELEPALGSGYAGTIAEPTCGSIYASIYNSYIQQDQTTNGCDGSNFMGCLTNPVSEVQMSQAQSAADENPQVQACRQKVLENPSEYPSDYDLGTPYVSTVGPKTKAFIASILSRFN